MDNNRNAIEIRHLTKVFKTRKSTLTAVDDLSLDIKKGEIFGLLGSNGAGKTTTVRMLCGLAQPTSGTARIMGKDILTQSTDAKQLINISPQEAAVAANLTVRENLELNTILYGYDKQYARNKADEIMQRFSLMGYADTRAKKLSGGYAHRLSIAMALVSDPQVLFLDEPTLGLDVRARHDLLNIIDKLKGSITIVLTTHYLEEVARLCDTIAVIHNGKLKAQGNLEHLKNLTGKTDLDEIFLDLTEEG